jgi:hypothetical protein
MAAATFSGRRRLSVDQRLKSLRFLRSLAANHFAGFSAAGKSGGKRAAVQTLRVIRASMDESMFGSFGVEISDVLKCGGNQLGCQ